MNPRLEPEKSDLYREKNNVAAPIDASLDDFVHTRTRILSTKLAVLATEMRDRLIIRADNLERIADDKARITDQVTDLTRRANYLMRQHKEKAPLYEQLFQLDVERRAQDVECWRDVVMVMRDFLYAWEAHEMAKAKAIFLDHA